MTPFEWIAIAIITVISSARLTRLVTVDDFPPLVWFRMKAFDKSEKWGIVWYCVYCFSFWATLLGPVLTGYYSRWNDLWWIVFGSLAAAYAAAIFVVLDPDPDGPTVDEEVEDEDDN
jgi:hypothetical protein